MKMKNSYAISLHAYSLHDVRINFKFILTSYPYLICVYVCVSHGSGCWQCHQSSVAFPSPSFGLLLSVICVRDSVCGVSSVLSVVVKV